MQVRAMEAAAPLSVCFEWRYLAFDEFCPQARSDLVEALPKLGMSDDGVFDASVYFTELFVNAITHHKVGGAEQVHVAIHEVVEDGRQWIGIAVTDAGRGGVRPPAESAPSREDFGHGLKVIRGMGARVTDVRLPGGYTVTAWTPVSDELRRRVCQCDCRNVHKHETSACSWLIEERDDQQLAVREDDPRSHLCAPCLAAKVTAADNAKRTTPVTAGR